MPFVLDASVAAGWFLPGEGSSAADAIAHRIEGEEVRVPDLFWHEVRNLLVMAARRGRLQEDLLFLALRKLDKLDLRNAGAGDASRVVQLALKHGLTAYDAAYLALAVEDGLQLA